MTLALSRKTADVLALRALNLDMAEQAIAWGWALLDAEIMSDGVFALTALRPPVHWGDANDLVDQITVELSLAQPADEAQATRWLAHGHLSGILAAGGDDFDALKRVSRLYFDHDTPDLYPFYLLKHAIREVERDGFQHHWQGLTQQNWREILCDTIRHWQSRNPAPAPFAR